MTIVTSGLRDTLAANLGAHAAKPTAVTKGLTEASLEVWSDDKVSTGLWECTAGTFTAVRDGYTEICTVLSGSVTVEVDGQEAETYGVGDIIVMPSGWEGTWVVHEPMRKHFTIIND